MPKTKALKHLEQLLLAESKQKYPNVPDHVRSVNTFTTTANKEAKQLKRINSFVNLYGGCKSNIIINKGVRKVSGVDKINFFTGEVSGKTVTWDKSGMQKGIRS